MYVFKESADLLTFYNKVVTFQGHLSTAIMSRSLIYIKVLVLAFISRTMSYIVYVSLGHVKSSLSLCWSLKVMLLCL